MSFQRECVFFQAEDGIRDLTVTGVQTCALPICRHCSLLHGWYAAELVAQRSNPGQQHALASIADRSCEFKAFARRGGGTDGEACRHGHACGAEMQCRSEEHTSELQSQSNLVCRLLLEKKNKTTQQTKK